MGLDTSGGLRPGAGGFQKEPNSRAECLNTARKSVFEILEKSKMTSLVIDKASDRLRGITDRLSGLDAAVRPLHSQSLVTDELGSVIDRAIEPAETILKTFDIVHNLESIIKGDPKTDMALYLASLAQLEEANLFLSRNFMLAVELISDAKDYLASNRTIDNYRMHRLNESFASVKQNAGFSARGGWDTGLLEVASGRLSEAFKSILLENSQGIELPAAVDRPEDPCDELASTTSLPVLLPPPIMAQLQCIAERLQTQKSTDSILDAYSEVRVGSIRESLRSLEPEYLRFSSAEKVDELEWADLEGMIELWTQQMEVACLILFKSERRLCARVFVNLEKEKWVRCWGRIASGGFSSFLSFGEGVVGSQTAPEKLFKLLDMYYTMETLLPHVFEVFEGSDAGCGDIRIRSRELLKRIARKGNETITKLCRFVEDGKGDVPSDGGRSRLCSYVVNYVKTLVSEFYGPIMSKIVRIDQTYREDSDSDEGLSGLVTDVMRSLEIHLVKQSKRYDDSALENVFMLNNLWYMMTRAKDSAIGPLLGESWMKDTKRKVRQHTLEYQREAWAKPLSYLNRDSSSLSGSGKGGVVGELARQKLDSFTKAFEENCRKHSTWVVSEQGLKEEIRLAVVQAVVPAYRSYIQAYAGFIEVGGKGGKDVKLSPEDVEEMLGDLFEVTSLDSNSRTLGNSRSVSANGFIQSF